MDTGSQLVSADGRWWWDGQRWIPTRGPELAVTIPIHRQVRLRFARDVEPEEIRARFGSILVAVGFVLTLPGMFAGTIFSMAIGLGQDPPWPTIAEGFGIFAVVLGFLGGAPLAGLLIGFGLRDGLRWVFLCLLLSGLMPGIVIGGLTALASGNTFDDFALVALVLAWMWALPALALVVLRATHTGRPLPHLRAFGRMFGRGWRDQLPGERTEWGEILFDGWNHARARLRVPGADFWLPPELWTSSGAVRVTYNLRQGTIEIVEVAEEEAVQADV